MVREIGLREAESNFMGLLEELRKGGEPLCITEDGKATVVMLNIDDYQILVNTIRSLSSDYLLV